MKILYLVHAFYPESHTGTEKFVYNISHSMKNQGCDVKVITYSFYDDHSYHQIFDHVMAKEFEYNGIPIVAFKHKNRNDLDNLALSHPEMRDFVISVLEKEKPDLVHAGHLMRTGEFIKVCIERNIPYILTLTDYYLLCPKYIMLKKDYMICNSCLQGKACPQACKEISCNTVERYATADSILKNAKAITAPSKFVKNLFESEFEAIDVKVVNHGLSRIHTRRKDKTYRKGDRLNFGYAGSFSAHKGIAGLIKVFSRFKDDITLSMYGGPKDHTILNLILKKYDINNIRLEGVYTEEQLAEVLEKIDVLIVPSIWHETYCFVIYEAMMNHVPVIFSNVGALPEKVKNGVEGFIYERDDLDQLEQIIKLIAENPEVLNRMKDNILNFRIPVLEEEVETYRKLYHQCFNMNESQVVANDNRREERGTVSFKNVFEQLYYTLNDWQNDAESCLISDLEWNRFLNSYSKDINPGLLYSLRYQLDYLKGKYKNQVKRCLIWGAGTSGKTTLMFLENFLPNFEIIGMIDSYSEGYYKDLEIYRPEKLQDLEFDLVFIATTPGKKAAQAVLEERGFLFLENYFFGYGVL